MRPSGLQIQGLVKLAIFGVALLMAQRLFRRQMARVLLGTPESEDDAKPASRQIARREK